MSLNYVVSSGDRVDHGSDASLDDLNPFTAIMWVRLTAFTNARSFYAKHSAGNRLIMDGTGGNIRFDRARNIISAVYITDDTPLSLNTWHLVAVTYNRAGGAGEVINIYVGSLTAEAVESSYGTSTDGAGAETSDAANNLFVGNISAFNRAPAGRIACFTYVDALLTLSQIRSWQFRPRKLVNAVIYSQYGFNGIGTQPDWSGNGNNGTVTTATVADHVPLGPSFGLDLEGQGIVTAAVGGTILPQILNQGLYTGGVL